jgi:Fe-S-cluster containining protein
MAARSGTKRHLPAKVAEVYNWLDSQTEQDRRRAGVCEACGRCCNFDNYDHRLFVTTPELMYLAANLGGESIKPMKTRRCPYNANGKCTVYRHRFVGCRVFCCRGNADFQSELSESALRELRSICAEFKVDYRYSELASALNGFAGVC